MSRIVAIHYDADIVTQSADVKLILQATSGSLRLL